MRLTLKASTLNRMAVFQGDYATDDPNELIQNMATELLTLRRVAGGNSAIATTHTPSPATPGSSADISEFSALLDS